MTFGWLSAATARASFMNRPRIFASLWSAAGRILMATRRPSAESAPAEQAENLVPADALGKWFRGHRAASIGVPAPRSGGREGVRIERQQNRQDASLIARRRGESRAREEAKHPLVVLQDFGLEDGDLPRAGERGETLKKKASEAAALEVVRHRERDLRVRGPIGEAFPSRDSHDGPRRLGDDGVASVVIHVREVRDLPRVLVGDGEEAEMQALERKAVVERQQTGPVVSPDGAQVHRRAVPKDDVRLLRGGIGAARAIPASGVFSNRSNHAASGGLFFDSERRYNAPSFEGTDRKSTRLNSSHL